MSASEQSWAARLWAWTLAAISAWQCVRTGPESGSYRLPVMARRTNRGDDVEGLVYAVSHDPEARAAVIGLAPKGESMK